MNSQFRIAVENNGVFYLDWDLLLPNSKTKTLIFNDNLEIQIEIYVKNVFDIDTVFYGQLELQKKQAISQNSIKYEVVNTLCFEQEHGFHNYTKK